MNLVLDDILFQADQYERGLLPAPEPLTAPVGVALAGWLDQSLLRPEVTRAEVASFCLDARQYPFASVCINPSYVPLAAQSMAGSQTRVCAVVAFPFGASLPELKAHETSSLIAQGATEIDMVINIGALKGADWSLALEDVQAVVSTASGKALVKVIFETALLTRREKIIGCLLAKFAGADFVKTSTGFAAGGATADDVRLMRGVVGAGMGVKASGGIRTLENVQVMIAAGANRIGTSAGVSILQGVAV